MIYKLLALDLDGTVLNSQSELSPRTVQAVRLACRSGMKVCLVSGRSPRSMLPIAKDLGLDSLVVGFNSGLIVDPTDMTCLRQVTIPWDAIQPILKRWRQAGLTALAYRNTFAPPDVYFCVPPKSSKSMGYLRYEDDHLCKVAELCSDLGWEPLRIIVADDHERTSFALRVARPYLEDPRLVWYHARHYDTTWYLEIYPPVSKAQGIDFLCRYYDIHPSYCVAVGDHVNDIEMLKASGLGVAMGNSHPEVTKHAQMVIGHHDEDGLAQFIEDLLDGKAVRPA